MRDGELTPLGEGAAQAHELFRAYVNAGFSEQQALYLVGKMLTAGVGQG